MFRLGHKTRDVPVTKSRPGWGMAVLFLAAALDASFLPFPVTTMFVVMSLTRPTRTTAFAVIAVSGTLAGAVAGYMAGRYLWIGTDGEYTGIADFCFRIIPGFSAESYESFKTMYNKWDVGVILFASATAIPFGLISVSAGLFSVPFVIFAITALIGQAAKYLVVAFLCHRYGSRALAMLRYPVIVLCQICSRKMP